MPQMQTSTSVSFITDEDAARRSYQCASQPAVAVEMQVQSSEGVQSFAGAQTFILVITQFRRFDEKEAAGDKTVRLSLLS